MFAVAVGSKNFPLCVGFCLFFFTNLTKERDVFFLIYIKCISHALQDFIKWDFFLVRSVIPLYAKKSEKKQLLWPLVTGRLW